MSVHPGGFLIHLLTRSRYIPVQECGDSHSASRWRTHVTHSKLTIYSLVYLMRRCPNRQRSLPIFCGDDGVRTRDLVVANHALSQLSYIPLFLSFAIRKQQWAYLDSNQGPQLYQSCALAN